MLEEIYCAESDSLGELYEGCYSSMASGRSSGESEEVDSLPSKIEVP